MSGIEIAAGISAFAGLAGAAGSLIQGQQVAGANEFNAQQFEAEAEQARVAARFEEKLARERTKRVIASGRAAAGAAGFEVDAGSPLTAQLESAEQGELDALAIRYSGSVAEARAKGQAARSRFQARVGQSEGFFDAGTSLLTGVGRAVSLLE